MPGTVQNAPDKAFGFTAPGNAIYAIDTIGSNFDTVLYVRNGTCTGTELACNDNITTPGNVQSKVTLGLTNGQSVVIVVDGFGTSSGNFVLNVSAPCPQATASGALPLTINGNTAGRISQVSSATCVSGSTNASDATFGFTAPTTGSYTIDTIGSGFDTVLSVRNGSCGGAQLSGGCNDDIAPPGNRQSQVTVSLTAGQQVVIVIDGFGTASGLFTLHISAPS